MEYTIQEIGEKVFEPIHNVYNIFKDYFGEDYVDLHSQHNEHSIKSWLTNIGRYTPGVTKDDKIEITDSEIRGLRNNFVGYADIFVWWPKVTITNENDKSINIQDLYACITINGEGCIPYEYHGFMLNRATYSVTQFMCNYMHSHICDIPREDFEEFQEPCLGEGPIKGTIVSLKNEYDETLWLLFCRELSMYVTVESLTGIPYHNLETVGRFGDRIFMEFERYRKSQMHTYLNIFSDLLHIPFDNFIRYYLRKGHLKFSYEKGEYKVGMTYYEYRLDISNAFIEFLNEYFRNEGRNLDVSSIKQSLISRDILQNILVKNQEFYRNAYSEIDVGESEGAYILTFKGNDIYLHVFEDEYENFPLVLLLGHNISMYVLTLVLKIINYRYTNGTTKIYNRTRQRQSFTTIGKTVRFLL